MILFLVYSGECFADSDEPNRIWQDAWDLDIPLLDQSQKMTHEICLEYCKEMGKACGELRFMIKYFRLQALWSTVLVSMHVWQHGPLAQSAGQCG